jgi:hypothetical protein
MIAADTASPSPVPGLVVERLEDPGSALANAEAAVATSITACRSPPPRDLDRS